MSYLKKFEEEHYFIQQEDGHNKFWTARADTEHTVVIRWGRLGTTGQSQTKTHDTTYGASNFIRSKLREKTNKGYRPISKEAFEKEHLAAAVVGASNKCESIDWVELGLKDEKPTSFFLIPIERLSSPDCTPALLVNFTTKKVYDSRTHFKLLFTAYGTYDAAQYTGRLSGQLQLIEKGNPLFALTEKIEQAIGYKMV